MDSEKASYVAEAGIQQALWLLSDPQESQPWNWQGWPANYKGTGGTLITAGTLKYYQWSGNLGDSNQTYTVQIRNDGKIQSKIKVGSPNLNPPSRIIEVELGSAFDFGLYSHKALEFQSSNFMVNGSNQTGYVYAKDNIAGSSYLTADKVTGTYQNAPWFLPKGIPLPELWKTKTVNPQTGNITWIGFEAKINGAPTSTIVRYNNDNGEDKLEKGALLHNKTRGNFRQISATVDPDKGTNTIITEASTDDWVAGDKIVLERIEVYENYWTTLNTQLDNLNSASYGFPYSALVYEPDVCSPSQSFSDVNFSSTPTVQFKGNTMFSGNIKINGNAIFGRKHDYGSLPFCVPTNSSGETTIAGDMVINGNAYFFNKVSVTGHLYVVGSVYMWDQSSYNITCETITITESSSGSPGITIDTGGGLFVQGGTLTINENLQSGGVIIRGYCYVNEDVKIFYGNTGGFGFTGTTEISNYRDSNNLVNPATVAFYVRNGSLTLGDPDNNLLTNLLGRGRIIVGKDITIMRDLYTNQTSNQTTDPLSIASGGNLTIRRNVGGWSNQFYGMVYAGENAEIQGSTRIRGGLMVVNGLDPNRPYLSGRSIAYQDYKSLLTDVGFTNNEDFVRPLLWRETTE
jgi:hypothetical protein